MFKKIVSIFIVITLSFCFCGCEKGKTEIYDYSGKIFSELTTNAQTESLYSSYIDIVTKEAVEILMKKQRLEEKIAEKSLYGDNYKIYTYANTDLIKASKSAREKYCSQTDFATAITDLNGKLIATYGTNKDTNLATLKMPPYSTIKPISVYSQAIETNQLHWSSMIEDSPYKTITEQSGETRDWPSNSTSTYLNAPVSLAFAIKNSLNTIAVKALSDYGVSNSLSFMKSKLGLELKEEEYKTNIFGEEEVLGNIALGYTVNGISPAEMAGYYQIFANGGNYTKPCAIQKIVDKNGDVIYEDKTETARILSEETAYICNELLKGVVNGGTGAKAFSPKVSVAGKTGTGDSNSGNWFIGVTPEYSCAVWHSVAERNNSAEIFSFILDNMEIKIKDFRTSKGVIKKIYCKESGMLLSEKCTQADMGFYKSDNLPDVCNVH